MKKIISMMICFSLLLFAVKLDINAEEISIMIGNTDVLSTSMEGIKYENGKLYLDNFISSERLVIKGVDRIEIVVTGENRIESNSRVPFSSINTYVTFSGGGKLVIVNKTQSGVPALYYGNESGCGMSVIGMTITDKTEVFAETNVKDGTAVLIGFNSDASKKDRGLAVKDGGSDEPNNGICLCANHHLMFDGENGMHLITISEDQRTFSCSSTSEKKKDWYIQAKARGLTLFPSRY